ncbi:cytochrome C oxidase subunit IV family protein [Aquisalimonas sp.]|uniref:cytochrome C oxidase subunit IV family protein n=1 Tax=Aquisalimonas sp. TaxID=1872621 RepID=UPI0025C34220|nr:cytochrome C oxidase subunit IV family protein [Aquisalimonas sp.]
MSHALPGRRKLVITWAVLVGLTLASMTGGLFAATGAGDTLAWWAVAVILAATYYKARQIVMVYLNLNASSSGWRSMLRAFLIITLALILGGYLLPQLL